jgi:hypothetical protein
LTFFWLCLARLWFTDFTWPSFDHYWWLVSSSRSMLPGTSYVFEFDGSPG